MWIYGVALLAMVGAVQTLKYSLKRPRPEQLSHTYRFHSDLRKKEEGTYAMPSGDSAAAAIFCFIYAFIVGVPSVYIILPLVMAGRVYY
jgi:membrane-associated phospholipid phosphatase